MTVVYFMQRGDDGPIKIGTTKNVQRRLQTLQNGCPEELHIRGIVPGCFDMERRLHEQFAFCRLVGEWFEPHPELLDAVAKADAWVCEKARRGYRILAGKKWPEKTLQAYMEARKLNAYHTAQRLEVAPSTVTRFLRGEASISPELALAIEERSQGEIDAGQLSQVVARARATA